MRVEGSEFRVQGSEFGVRGRGLRAQSLGFGVRGSCRPERRDLLARPRLWASSPRTRPDTVMGLHSYGPMQVWHLARPRLGRVVPVPGRRHRHERHPPPRHHVADATVRRARVVPAITTQLSTRSVGQEGTRGQDERQSEQDGSESTRGP